MLSHGAPLLWTLDDRDSEAIWIAFRPGYLLILFLAGWAMNVAVFGQFRIDYGKVLGIGKDEVVSVQRLFMLALTSATSLGFLRQFLLSTTSPIVTLQSMLVGYALGVCGLFTWLPTPIARHVQWRVPLARALWRSICPNTAKEVPFVEVLVADGLTSLAKVFFDLAVASCVAVSVTDFSFSGSSGSDFFLDGLHSPAENFNITVVANQTVLPKRLPLGDALAECKKSPVPFLAWASPFLIRARQCMITARHAPDSLSRDLQRVNLLKYLTALPIVVFSLCYVRSGARTFFFVFEAEDFEVLWAMAAVINSIFSFMWDLVMDWGLLQPSLRPVLLFRGVWGFYHIAIICNLLGRTLWSLRWSPRATLFLGAFFLASLQQGAEVIRRCLWSVLRVEWECIKKGVHRDDKHFPV